MIEDCITVRGLQATGYHGVFDYERRDGQLFIIDLDLWLAIDTHSDDLTHTVDYSAICDGVLDIVTGEPVNLIETLAGRVARYVLSYDLVDGVTVSVHKPQAPMRALVTGVSVTITRRKNDSVRS